MRLIWLGQESRISCNYLIKAGSFLISFSISGACSSMMTLISLIISFLTFFRNLLTVFSSNFSTGSTISSKLALDNSLIEIKKSQILKTRVMPKPVKESNWSLSYKNMDNWIDTIIAFRIMPSRIRSHLISLTTNSKIFGFLELYCLWSTHWRWMIARNWIIKTPASSVYPISNSGLSSTFSKSA